MPIPAAIENALATIKQPIPRPIPTQELDEPIALFQHTVQMAERENEITALKAQKMAALQTLQADHPDAADCKLDELSTIANGLSQIIAFQATDEYQALSKAKRSILDAVYTQLNSLLERWSINDGKIDNNRDDLFNTGGLYEALSMLLEITAEENFTPDMWQALQRINGMFGVTRQANLMLQVNDYEDGFAQNTTLVCKMVSTPMLDAVITLLSTEAGRTVFSDVFSNGGPDSTTLASTLIPHLTPFLGDERLLTAVAQLPPDVYASIREAADNMFTPASAIAHCSLALNPGLDSPLEPKKRKNLSPLQASLLDGIHTIICKPETDTDDFNCIALFKRLHKLKQTDQSNLSPSLIRAIDLLNRAFDMNRLRLSIGEQNKTPKGRQVVRRLIRFMAGSPDEARLILSSDVGLAILQHAFKEDDHLCTALWDEKIHPGLNADAILIEHIKSDNGWNLIFRIIKYKPELLLQLIRQGKAAKATDDRSLEGAIDNHLRHRDMLTRVRKYAQEFSEPLLRELLLKGHAADGLEELISAVKTPCTQYPALRLAVQIMASMVVLRKIILDYELYQLAKEPAVKTFNTNPPTGESHIRTIAAAVNQKLKIKTDARTAAILLDKLEKNILPALLEAEAPPEESLQTMYQTIIKPLTAPKHRSTMAWHQLRKLDKVFKQLAQSFQLKRSRVSGTSLLVRRPSSLEMKNIHNAETDAAAGPDDSDSDSDSFSPSAGGGGGKKH